MDDKRIYYLELLLLLEENPFRRCRCIKILEKQVSATVSDEKILLNVKK